MTLILLGVVLILLLVLTLFSREKEKSSKDEAISQAAAEQELITPEAASITADSISSTEPLSALPEDAQIQLEATEEAPTTLIFTGDILLYNATLSRYQESGLSGILSEELAKTMRNADILMVNEEFPFSTRGEPAPDKEFTFRVDPTYVSAFTEMGVDLVGLANNHVLDFGTDALLDTFDTLDAAGLPYAGAGIDSARAGELQVIERNGKRFGFLAASRVWASSSWAAGENHPGVFGTYDPTALLAKIAEAKATGACDYLTVFVHWGIERNTIPEGYQRELASQYAAAGADLVIGMHPHVLQGIEIIGETPVFYSLGNFIFGGRTYQTAAVLATVFPDGTSEISVIPCLASGGLTTSVNGTDASAVFETINALSFDARLDADGKLQKN